MFSWRFRSAFNTTPTANSFAQDHHRRRGAPLPMPKSIPTRTCRPAMGEQPQQHSARSKAKCQSSWSIATGRCHPSKRELTTPGSDDYRSHGTLRRLTTIQERLALTDAYVESTLRNQDAAQGKWLHEDPSLAQIQQILVSRQ